MWFTRRRKRNHFLGRRGNAPEISTDTAESEVTEQSAEMHPTSESAPETVSTAENPEVANPSAEKPSETAAPAENLTERDSTAENGPETNPQREKPAESERTVKTVGDAFSGETVSNKSEDSNASEDSDASEDSNTSEDSDASEDSNASEESNEPEEGVNMSGDEAVNGRRPEEDAGKPQRSLYEWRREKRTKTPKPVKAVKRPLPLKNGVILGQGLPKICVPITGESREAVGEQAQQAAAEAPDLVEWRADCFRDLDNVEKIAEVLISLQEILGDIPILFTVRTKREGGKSHLSAEKYRSVILYAAGRPEISVIDIEGLNPEINTELLVSQVHELGMPVVASWHNFSKTPKKPELDLIFDRLARTGADVLKVAVMPKKPKDVLRLMSVTEEKNRQISSPLVTMAMGDLGRISRVGGRITGSAMTFGSVGEASAPGQLPVGELRRIMKDI